jgi:hypothetical protein
MTDESTKYLDFIFVRMEAKIRDQIAKELERQATCAMISNEYNFNDTAVRAKTYHHAAQIAKGNND